MHIPINKECELFMQQISPEMIIQEARSWIGTRFHHQGRLKQSATDNGGVDCLGLLVGIAKALDLNDKNGKALYTHDEIDYPHIPDGIYLQHRLATLAQKVEEGDIRTADIVIFQIDNSPRHLAIISNTAPCTMIHAYAPARKVVEHELTQWWRDKIAGIYRFHIECQQRS